MFVIFSQNKVTILHNRFTFNTGRRRGYIYFLIKKVIISSQSPKISFHTVSFHFLFILCVYVVCVHSCVCMCMWRPVVNSNCLPQLSSTLLFDTESHWIRSSSIQLEWVTLELHISDMLGLHAHSTKYSFLKMWVLGIGTQVLVLALRALYQFSHLPNSRFLMVPGHS